MLSVDTCIHSRYLIYNHLAYFKPCDHRMGPVDTHVQQCSELCPEHALNKWGDGGRQMGWEARGSSGGFSRYRGEEGWYDQGG